MISALALLLLSGAPPSPDGARVAVIVGSNVAVAGRNVLRFAHQDASAFAQVLEASGGFEKADVEVLLDAPPAAVLEGLERARVKLHAHGRGGVLIFYYSGHADERALYPGGAPLPLEQLRAQLADEQVGVRIGIIDACRGGGWTQAKGLSPTAPFAVGLAGLSSEGTALLAASSGLEDAHETDALQGSFFTHHLVAGLRGAADASGDGQVTLSEAFAYANRFTVRDTARRAALAQHPSFDLRLRGRQDVVLTSLAQTSTQLLLAQRVGPLEVVQLSTGVTVVEAAPGEQVLRLALPPGPYLVRRVSGGEVLSREVLVRDGEATSVDESALTLVGTAAMPTKGPEGRLAQRQQLQLDVSSDPFDLYSLRLGGSLGYTFLFAAHFGVRAHGTLLGGLDTPAKQQLLRDFGVLPSAFAGVLWALDADLVWQPTILRGRDSEIFATLGLGAAVGGLVQGTSLVRVVPGPTGSAALTWLFELGGGVSLGATLAVHEGVFLSAAGGSVSTSLLTTFNLGALMTFGGPRG